MALNGFVEMRHRRPRGGVTERMAGGVLDNWIWGLSLITLTMTVHATGVAAMPSAAPFHSGRRDHARARASVRRPLPRGQP